MKPSTQVRIERVLNEILFYLLIVVAVLLLTSCESLWLEWYRAKGGYHQRPSQPTLEEAAENMKLLTGRDQPTYY